VKNTHCGEKISNKSTRHDGKKNADVVDP